MIRWLDFRPHLTQAEIGPDWIATAGIGQNQSFAQTMPKVRLPIRKRTIKPIAAPHNDLFLGYVGSMDLVAL